MILVFIFLGIIIFLVFETILFLLSTINVQINNLKIDNKASDTLERVNNKYEIKIVIKFLEKIPIFMIKLDKNKIEKIKNSSKIKNLDFNKLTGKFKQENISKKQIYEFIKNIKINIKELYLIISIGTEEATFTSYIVAFCASIIGIVLPHVAGKNIDNCKYIVIPIFQNKNEYHVTLNGIFCIKIVHIICNTLKLYRKGRNVKNERASNRRSYAYRYE